MYVCVCMYDYVCTYTHIYTYRYKDDTAIHIQTVRTNQNSTQIHSCHYICTHACTCMHTWHIMHGTSWLHPITSSASGSGIQFRKRRFGAIGNTQNKLQNSSRKPGQRCSGWSSCSDWQPAFNLLMHTLFPGGLYSMHDAPDPWFLTSDGGCGL